jgi:HD-like signal output (HDOD) protein
MEIQEKIEDLIRDKLTQLPTLPVVVNNVLKVAGASDSSANDLAGIILNDQAISNKILRLANSSYYGMSAQISSIPRAIAVIGFNEVVGLTIGMSVFSAIPTRRINSTSLDMEGLWMHAIGVGTAAKIIVRQLEKESSEQIFLAGLLHDMGKIVFSVYFPEEYSNVLRSAEEDKVPLINKEKEILGTDHEILARLLMTQWNFPDSITLPATSHHNYTNCPLEHLRSARIIQLADIVCHRSKIGYSGNSVIRARMDTILEDIKITPTGIAEVVSKLKEQRSGIEDFFKLIT